jgi:hypothetical protein
VRLNALKTSALEDLGWMAEASPAIKLGFVVTGDDESAGYGSQQRYGPSNRVGPAGLGRSPLFPVRSGRRW